MSSDEAQSRRVYCFFNTSCMQQLFTFLHATLYFLEIGNALARSFTYDASANS